MAKHEETETLWAVKITPKQDKPTLVKFLGKTDLFLKRRDASYEAKQKGRDAKPVKVRVVITEL
jgi:hypothetical protein